MKKLLHSVEKLLGIYRWHPKIALRYLPVVNKIRKQFPDGADVLEVGSSGLGIAPYLKQKVVGLDVQFPPPIHPLLVPVKGTTTAIPFSDTSFDVVLSLDMLEHLPQYNRRMAIADMLRVAKKMLVVGAPCGELAHTQDEQLRTEFKKMRGHDFSFLSEQVEYGVPTKEELVNLITDAANKTGRNISITIQGNINLDLRLWLMRGWMSDNLLVNLFFRKVMLLFIPLMRTMNKNPVYRQIAFVTIKE